jgi:hypothetical protein
VVSYRAPWTDQKRQARSPVRDRGAQVGQVVGGVHTRGRPVQSGPGHLGEGFVERVSEFRLAVGEGVGGVGPRGDARLRWSTMLVPRFSTLPASISRATNPTGTGELTEPPRCTGGRCAEPTVFLVP